MMEKLKQLIELRTTKKMLEDTIEMKTRFAHRKRRGGRPVRPARRRLRRRHRGPVDRAGAGRAVVVRPLRTAGGTREHRRFVLRWHAAPRAGRSGLLDPLQLPAVAEGGDGVLQVAVDGDAMPAHAPLLGQLLEAALDLRLDLGAAGEVAVVVPDRPRLVDDRLLRDRVDLERRRHREELKNIY